jgi:hypothetical protein
MAATLRKYITVSPSQMTGSDDLGKVFKKMTIAQNRMGGAVTNIGVQLTEFKTLVEMYQESTVGFLQEEIDISTEESEHRKKIIEAKTDALGRKKGLQQDKLAEKKQESLNEKGEEKAGLEEGKKEKKSRFGWLKALLKPMAVLMGGLMKLVAIPIAMGVMDWLGDEKNKEKIIKLFNFFKGVWNLASTFTRWGVGTVLDGITDVFGYDPDKGMIGNGLDKMFGVLKILAGFAAIHIGSRILMPWKLLSDVKFMFGLGKAVDAADSMGCGPKVKKPKGKRIGRDGRTSKQRLKDIKRAKRIRRIKALRSQITKRFTAAATGINGLFKKPPTPAVKPTPKTPFQLEQARKQATQQAMGLGDEVAEAAATNKGVVGTLRNIWSGTLDAGAVAKSKLKEGGTFALKQVGRLNNWFGARAGAMIDGVKGMGQGIWDFGKRAAKSLGDVVEMAKNPKALAAKVTTKVKNFIKPILEKNPQAKKIAEFAELPRGQQVKTAGKSVVSFLASGFKNPGFKTMREFLGAAKSSMKIGGIDTLIASVMALLDYGAFGESPINAILKALGGLLGYSAGFAIGAPFGGVPGFITGAAGGFAGEWAGEQLLGLLAKTGLADIDDPIAKQLGGDFPQRKLVRDPNGEMPGMEALMGAAENDGDGTAEITPPELPEMAKGGAIRAHNQGTKRFVDPIILKRKDTAKTPVSDWGKFAKGGTVNGQLPDEDLVSIGSGHKLAKGIAPQFKAMMQSASESGFKMGTHFRINSSYRTYDKQKQLYDQLGPGTAAYPGTSNHGLGKAVDLWYTNASYKWLRKNAGKFGFGQIPGYETDNPDGHEAWHWENLSGSGSKDGAGSYVASGDAGGGNTGGGGSTAKTGDNSGGGDKGGATPQQEYRSTGSIVDFFKKSAGILGSYASDASAMDGSGMPPSPIPTSTSMPKTPLNGIGPLVDGGAYAESLKPKSETNIGPVADGAAYATKINDAAKSKTTAPSSINTKAEKLKSLSTAKVRRDKQPAKPDMMIAVQPVIKTKTVNAGGGGGGNSGPASSPLLTQ